MRRRTFLFAAAAALAAPAKPVRVGAHLWVYAAKQPGYDPTFVLDQIFTELGAAGLDGLELMHQALLHEDSVEHIGALSRENKLPIIGTSWSGNLWDRSKREADLESIRTIVPRLGKLRGRTLGISVGDARRNKTEAEFDLQAASLREIMKICADHGVVPNLHNHVYEVRDGEHDLNGTLARIPEIKLGPDLGWLHRAKVDPVDFIRRRGKQMVFAHLRNDTAGGTWPEDMTEGVMDYAAIGKALRDVGFTGDLVIELAHERSYVPTRSLGESFRISREYVRRVMGY
jgi:sugar phosphate isomerase/epimerase